MSYFDANNNIYFEIGKTNYYGNYKFGSPHETQSVHDRPVSANAVAADRIAGHMNAGFAAVIGGSVGNKHVTLSPHSAMTDAIGGQTHKSLLSMERGYSSLDTDDSYSLDAVLSDETWQYYAFRNLSGVQLLECLKIRIIQTFQAGDT